jgi:hypothetical protein
MLIKNAPVPHTGCSVDLAWLGILNSFLKALPVGGSQ